MALVALVPQQVDVELYRGDDANFGLIFTDSAGTPIDFTGATLKAQIRPAINAPDPPTATFSTAVSANTVTYSLASAATTTLPAAAVWDCQVTDTAGRITTIAAGAVRTKGEVSR